MSLMLHFHTPTTPLSLLSYAAKTRRSSYTSITTTSCQKQPQEHQNDGVHRRNLLLASGGLTMLGAYNKAFADPIKPPDLADCHQITDVDCKNYNCCPPYKHADPVDFVPPGPSEPLRVRQAAHNLIHDPEYLNKFELAISKMKNLDKDDPWNFMQQANIHCAFCNDAFNQVGFNPKVPLQVHMSWLFLPWHRYYIYFWERILGKLIKDPTFSIPYWNWDTKEGMRMPSVYLNPSSFLYDKYRDHRHDKALMDYNYKFGDCNPTPEQEDEVVIYNYNRLRRIYSSDNLKRPELFMGKAVRAGQNPENWKNSSGALESLHNTVHNWTGQIVSPYWDMGNFHTAARDPIFFAHHGNIDRMWDIYRNMRGKQEFKDPDWLDASFIFYDENRKVVKCKVRDCLRPENLRYKYESEETPWDAVRERYLHLRRAKINAKSLGGIPTSVTGFGAQPRVLDSTIRAIVERLTSIGETKKSEVLIIDDIEFDHQSPLRLDVYVAKLASSDDGFLVGPDLGELAGSFVNVPHAMGRERTESKRTMLQLGISDLLMDIEGTTDGKVVVSLVPRLGEVKVGGIRIVSLTDDPDE